MTQAMRQVVLYPNRPHATEHERASLQVLGEWLAAQLGWNFAGEFQPGQRYSQPLYFIPADTLTGETAESLGIVSAEQLFGGVVPQPFMATKVITHSLLDGAAQAPEQWTALFSELVRDCVLQGFSVFNLGEAKTAGLRLLKNGPVRIKPVRATAGRGQMLIENAQQLDAALQLQAVAEVSEFGLVLEEHLEDVTTYSVGQVNIGPHLISYYGTQSLTPNQHGEQVYGGSDLVVAKGDFTHLLALPLPKTARLAVAQAQIYDEAAQSCFPEFFASRRNYDVAQGIGARGALSSGVLEQSWRIGGASSAELAAMQAFLDHPEWVAVRSCSTELHGENAPLPVSEPSKVIFRGADRDVGFISKSVRVEPYGDTQ